MNQYSQPSSGCTPSLKKNSRFERYSGSVLLKAYRTSTSVDVPLADSPFRCCRLSECERQDPGTSLETATNANRHVIMMQLAMVEHHAHGQRSLPCPAQNEALASRGDSARGVTSKRLKIDMLILDS